MTDYDITKIADARYMGLMCPPASPEARALVADIIDAIGGWATEGIGHQYGQGHSLAVMHGWMTRLGQT